MEKWVWQKENWAEFKWDEALVAVKLRLIHHKIGRLVGESVASPDAESLPLDTLLTNLIASSLIEDETLNIRSLKSSLARRLGITEENPAPIQDKTEGLANIMMDAVVNHNDPLTMERLLQWHGWLFQTIERFDYSAQKIKVGDIRDNKSVMQVVGGSSYSNTPTKVYFEAPEGGEHLQGLMNDFLEWFNNSKEDVMLDPLLRAALAHFWFVTLHPFEDGNGRITRVITDLALAQMDHQSIRLYAMSVAIHENRNSYYEVLEKCQNNTYTINDWLLWFLDVLEQSIDKSLVRLHRTIAKAQFWNSYSDLKFNDYQKKVINRLLQGEEKDFPLGIKSSQYASVAGVSKATATRHLSELLEWGVLYKLERGGRSTRYVLTIDKERFTQTKS
jgi:Fic family protein